MPTINGVDVPFGCIIDSHWGQYVPDRLAEIAESSWGLQLDHDHDPRYWRGVADSTDSPDEQCNAWDAYYWAADALEQLINDRADGVAFVWFDGDGFIVDPDDTEGWSEW